MQANQLPRYQFTRRSNDDRITAQMPGYTCYCCCDSGTVQFPDEIIPGYDLITDPAVACTRRGCYAASNRYGESTRYLDSRATREQCEWLHRQNYEDWRSSCEKWSTDPKILQRQQAAIAQKVSEIANHLADPADSEIEF